MELPNFKYHPDPIHTGSIKISDAECKCCGESRGYIYDGPVYATAELRESICPFCIADDSAHLKFGASFVDVMGVGGEGAWDIVPEEVIAEIAFRTPSFSGWQQEQWWTHCNDGAEFLGIAGYVELQQYGEEAVEAIRQAFSNDTDIKGEELNKYIEGFHRDNGPTAYIFKCRHCQKLGGYWDSH